MLGHRPSFRHYLRVIVTYVFLLTAVAGGTYFVIQLAQGYQLNLNQQGLVLTGLIRFESNPDATVIIDGKNSGEQTPARLSLVEGDRQIALEQDGFQRWSRDIIVDGGSVNWITYPFLIPFDVEAGTEPALALDEADRYSFDQTGSLLAVAETGRIVIYQLQSGEFDQPYRQLNVVTESIVDQILWAESSEQLLYKTIQNGDVSWFVADISELNPEIVNLTGEIGSFRPQGFVVDVEPKILLSREGQLWLLSVEDKTLQLLTRQADAFTLNNSAVVWHEADESESLQAWSNNERVLIPVLNDIEGSVELALSSFSNQTSVAYTQSGSTKVIIDALSAPFERELNQFSSVTSISPGGRFVLGSSDDGSYFVHDIEQNQTYNFALVDQLSTLKWSGTHHFVARGDSGVYVVDYEGSNQRRINFEQANSAVLNAQKTAVFSVVDEQLLITPLR